jgi:hypothetical protein
MAKVAGGGGPKKKLPVGDSSQSTRKAAGGAVGAKFGSVKPGGGAIGKPLVSRRGDANDAPAGKRPMSAPPPRPKSMLPKPKSVTTSKPAGATKTVAKRVSPTMPLRGDAPRMQFKVDPNVERGPRPGLRLGQNRPTGKGRGKSMLPRPGVRRRRRVGPPRYSRTAR